MEVSVIINPAAGGGRSVETWKAAQQILAGAGWDLHVAFTRYRGHATELAAEAVRQGTRLVVAVGGDGTAHEVVNGLPIPGTVNFGLIPGGTGNDFAKTLGIPLDARAAAAVLVQGAPRVIDIGRVLGTFFLNVAGVGFDAEVSRVLNRAPKILPGAVAYVWGILRTILFYHAQPTTLTMDTTTWQGKSLLAAVGNAKFYGGGMMMCPHAVIDDGRFSVVVGGDLNVVEVLMVLPSLFKGQHLSHPKVTEFESVRVAVDGPARVPVHADGEVIGSLPAVFDLIPHALPVIVPATDGPATG